MLSGLLENPSFREQFGNPNDVITGITVSSYCLGALFGCVLNFAIGDMLGRRYMIWMAMGLIIVMIGAVFMHATKIPGGDKIFPFASYLSLTLLNIV